MNNFEFTIHVGGSDVNIFTQPMFFNHQAVATNLHKHHYTEIHLIESGTVKYLIGNRYITVSEKNLLVIPEKTFHKCSQTDSDSRCIAFQLNRSFKEPAVYDSIPGLFTELRKEIQLAKKTGMCGKIPEYLALICADLFRGKAQRMLPIQDRKFIIHEFFSHNYDKNVSLSDLADELNLSLKQTERLIKEYNGSTFRKELSMKRIQAARHLIAAEDISLTEAAEQVGYHSYSGFWKAFHTQSKSLTGTDVLDPALQDGSV